MSALILRRQDLDFLLLEWLRVEQLIQRDRYADHNAQTFGAALDTYEAIAKDHFAPHNKSNDQCEPCFEDGQVRVNPEIHQAMAAFAEAGLMAARQDYDLEGMQLPFVVERAGMAMVMAANVATAGYAFLTIANAELLLAHGSPDLVERYVRPMMQGRFYGTMCLSEPQAGSSLADIRTRAQPQPDGTYRLQGNKMWISGGEHDVGDNIVHLVLAKIPGPDGRILPGVKGISLFLVPRVLIDEAGNPVERNDVVVAGLNHKMGYRGLPNCLLNFGEGVHQPLGGPGAVGWRVGEAGEGLACMFKMMNEARIAVGLGAAALGCTGYLHALDYARTRPQGRLPGDKQADRPMVPIIEHADVRRMLLAQKAYAEGSLALVLYSAALIDDQLTGTSEAVREEAGQLLDLLTPVTKSWPSQWCLVANDLAIQVHGGYGYTREYNVEQFYRDNRLNPIHEGTFGIQAIDLVGRKLGQHGGQGLRILDRRVRATVASAGRIEPLRDDAQAIEKVWARVMLAARQLQRIENPSVRLSNASPFLEAFGHAVMGWLWMDLAVVAQQRLLSAALDEDSKSFYQGKLQASAYFQRWEIPKVDAWLRVVESGDSTCLQMADAWF